MAVTSHRIRPVAHLENKSSNNIRTCWKSLKMKRGFRKSLEHMLPFVERAFTALAGFAESMTRPLLPTPLNPQVYVIVPNRIAPMGPKQFHPVPSIEELSARVRQSAQVLGR